MKPILPIAAIVLAAAVNATAATDPNACQVLTAKDLRAVQGAPFEEAKLTSSTRGAFEVSQCFYRLPKFADSVSLTILRAPDGRGKDVARDYWNETFRKHATMEEEEREARERSVPAAVKGDRREEEEEPAVAAIPVRGLGDEAVWSGNRILGDLYVLRGDSILRVSVGGAGTVEQKMKAARRLAAKALDRMD